jgi:hypothetical protein
LLKEDEEEEEELSESLSVLEEVADEPSKSSHSSVS